jgi:hypothetical protein
MGLFLSYNDNDNDKDNNTKNSLIISKAFDLLKKYGFDFTTFFRDLSIINDIINKELKKDNYKSVENFYFFSLLEIKNIFNKEKLDDLFYEFRNKLIENSLNFEEKLSTQKLKINPIALKNLEEFMKGK